MLRRVALALSAFLLPSVARADDAPTPVHVDLGAQLAVLQGDNTSDWRSSLGFHAQARVTPHLRLGLRTIWAQRESTSSDESDRGEGFYRSWHLDARAEWHFLPSFVVDPWIAAGVGPYASWNYTPEGHYREENLDTCHASSRCWGAEVTGDAGVDFHLGAHFALGLFWSARAPLRSGRRTPEDRAAFYALFPSLRLAASF